MVLLELELKYGCCGRPRYKLKYHDELMQFVCHSPGIFVNLWHSNDDAQISKNHLKDDVRDLSKAYRDAKPSVCYYWIIPAAIALLSAVWLVIS